MRPCVARATGLTLPPSPAPTRGFSFLTPLPFNGGNVPFYRKSMMPPLQPLVRTSENSPLETVWKIAEGVSSTLLWRQEAADRDFFDPSWPLRSPDSGSIPNFQTVSEGEFSEVPHSPGLLGSLRALRWGESWGRIC